MSYEDALPITERISILEQRQREIMNTLDKIVADVEVIKFIQERAHRASYAPSAFLSCRTDKYEYRILHKPGEIDPDKSKGE